MRLAALSRLKHGFEAGHPELRLLHDRPTRLRTSNAASAPAPGQVDPLIRRAGHQSLHRPERHAFEKRALGHAEEAGRLAQWTRGSRSGCVIAGLVCPLRGAPGVDGRQETLT